jgi:hypothetical protein
VKTKMYQMMDSKTLEKLGWKPKLEKITRDEKNYPMSTYKAVELLMRELFPQCYENKKK